MTEPRRTEYDLNIELARRAQEENMRFFELMQPLIVKDAQAAIQAAILINGGAAVSVLAFVGALVGQNKTDIAHLRGVVLSLLFFAGGVAAVVSALCSPMLRITLSSRLRPRESSA
jgi:hypothetical protein